MGNPNSELYHLQKHVKKHVNLADFIERETGCKVNWYQTDTYAGIVCPMPNHREDKASFKIRLNEEHIWTFHCFGCNSKGTIINFCMDYYGIETWQEAVKLICNKLNIKMNSTIDTRDSKEASKKASLRKKIECSHLVSCNQCRNLLRKNYIKYNEWVALSYKIMNEALDQEDIDTIEAIGYQATDKIQEKI